MGDNSRIYNVLCSVSAHRNQCGSVWVYEYNNCLYFDRNIITIAFIVPLVGLLKNVRIQKRFLIWLGTISYEIYIIHPFILYFFEKETTEGKQVGNLEIVLWTIGLTLFLSSVLKVVQEILVRKVRS